MFMETCTMGSLPRSATNKQQQQQPKMSRTRPWSFNQRPEEALKKANGFIDFGKPSRALKTLYDVLKSKRNRTAPTDKILESIMLKYLELCVELKKSHSAKEGLFQYRNKCQTTNVASLEFVVKRYLELAEQKTAQSRKESDQAVLDVDDLDNIQTPEGILMRAVSGEDAQDRSDRTILMPWVKFLWESYRQCLELLRTNRRVESLYHYVARKGFSFCEEYKRKTEFRKLCDNLRTHLQNVTRQIPGGPNVINLQQPETQQMNLETRLDQLDKAIKMELWTEAFKAIEDIHVFTVLSKKTPVRKMLANYYEKLALVLWKAGNHLFHATALSKLFQLSKSLKKNTTAEELQDLATRVLVATLAIPLPSAHPEFDRFFETEKSAMEKQQRLAQLLYLQQPPTRAGLIKDLGRYNVVNYVHPKLKELYDALEVDFEPLKICVRVDGSLQFMRASEERLMKDLREYIPALQDITLTRLVKQLAQIYDNISYSNLLNLAVFSDFFSLERVIVNAVRHNDMQIRVDHRNECIHFGTDLAESQREEIEEGPTLQPMPSKVFRTQLINVSTTLTDFLSTVQNEQSERKNYETRARIVQQYFDHAQRDRAGILARQITIEAYKEKKEKQAREREFEEQKKQEEAARNQHIAEQKRLDLERQEREKKRQEDELQTINAKQFEDKIAQLTQSAHGQKVAQRSGKKKWGKRGQKWGKKRQLEELEKERRETANRLKSQEENFDHLERAKRYEEIPLLQKELEARQVKEKEEFQKEEKERVAHIIEERKIAVANKDRLLRMKDDKNVFLDMMIKRRREEYEGNEDYGPSPVLASRRFDDRWDVEDEEPVKTSAFFTNAKYKRKEYKRKTEFRKLCDNLRTHLQHVTRQIPGGPNGINLQQPETQQMKLETRLDQLDKAIKMELWTEAYKAIEDIHEFTVLSKKTPLPKMLANYYEKLALVLWKAGNQLFHATALSKLFQLSKSLKKNITAEELQDLATRVLVATLAIPLPSAHPEFDRFFETEKSAMEKQQRLAQLLYLQQPPTRAKLIKDLGRYNVVNYVHPKLKELYNVLEVDFEPLKLCARVDGSLQFIRTSEERLMKDLREYIPALQDITLTRLMKQLAQIYDNISYSNLLNLAVFSDFFSLERVIVNAVRHNDMQIRVDHRNECIHFGTDLAESQREEIEEDPTLQPMPSEVFRTQLINVSTTLTDFLSTVQNEQRERKNYEIRARIVQQYFDHAQRDRAGILARQKTIEAYKEKKEKQARERELEEQKKQEEAARNQHLAEQKRLDLERQEREKKRQEDELKAINAKQIKDKIAQLTQSAHGRKVAQRLGSEIKSVDPETLMARQLEELEKERRETANRLKSQEKKFDHMERAKRQEEIPLLQKELEGGSTHGMSSAHSHMQQFSITEHFAEQSKVHRDLITSLRCHMKDNAGTGSESDSCDEPEETPSDLSDDEFDSYYFLQEAEEKGKQRDAARSKIPTEHMHLDIEKELIHGQKVVESLVFELENLHPNEKSKSLDPEDEFLFHGRIYQERIGPDRWKGKEKRIWKEKAMRREFDFLKIKKDKKREKRLQEKEFKTLTAKHNKDGIGQLTHLFPGLQTLPKKREKRLQEKEFKTLTAKHNKDGIGQLTHLVPGLQTLPKSPMVETRNLETPSQLSQIVLQILQKDRKKELERQKTALRSREKEFDRFERAKRAEEIPLRQEWAKACEIKEKQVWKNEEKQRITHINEQRKFALANKDRFMRMKEDMSLFLRIRSQKDQTCQGNDDYEPSSVLVSRRFDDRWEGEDEEPVKDSWEDEDTEKKPAKPGVSKPKTRKRKTPEKKITEKEIIVHGVAEMDPDVTAESAFLSMCNEYFPCLSVHKNDLISSRRIGKQGSRPRPRPIIVQFSNLWIRQFLLKNKYHVRAAGIIFGETLTNSKLALRNYAKFRLGSSSVWVLNGDILHRTSSNNIIKIFSKKDVDDQLKS